jgi:hypothetical protein
MRTIHSLVSTAITSGVLLASTASVARADDRTLFYWSGTVDREIILVMRDAQLNTLGEGFDFSRDARFRVSEALPRMQGRVKIARIDGRGYADVIEQPTRYNGFTTRIRIRDVQGGADRYRLVVTWDAFDRRDDEYVRDDDRRGGRRGGWDSDRDFGRDDRFGNGSRDGRDDVGGRRDAGVLRFSGEVDDVAEIRIRGRQVEYFSRSGAPLYRVRTDVRGAALPTNYSVPLDVRRLAGRGDVTITQYPRAVNNWTAVIRISDFRAGADNYAIELRW